jgi:DDE superfamily endonuclease
LKEQWCIPTVSAEFVWRMEDVLDLYAQPYDSRFPVVCVDESPYQMVGEVRQPSLAQPGTPQRYDYQYQRNGTCNLFVFFEPRNGWRHVEVTARRTKRDFAQCMRMLVDSYYPEAEVIRLVVDNLNTHTPAALYEAFPPAEAHRILQRLEFHYTPKHGSWLNMVEIELSVLAGQCLKRRLPDKETVQHEVAAWERQRNDAKATVQWRFTTDKARTKLQRLYPSQPVW